MRILEDLGSDELGRWLRIAPDDLDLLGVRDQIAACKASSEAPSPEAGWTIEEIAGFPGSRLTEVFGVEWALANQARICSRRLQPRTSGNEDEPLTCAMASGAASMDLDWRVRQKPRAVRGRKVTDGARTSRELPRKEQQGSIEERLAAMWDPLEGEPSGTIFWAAQAVARRGLETPDSNRRIWHRHMARNT